MMMMATMMMMITMMIYDDDDDDNDTTIAPAQNIVESHVESFRSFYPIRGSHKTVVNFYISILHRHNFHVKGGLGSVFQRRQVFSLNAGTDIRRLPSLAFSLTELSFDPHQFFTSTWGQRINFFQNCKNAKLQKSFKLFAPGGKASFPQKNLSRL